MKHPPARLLKHSLSLTPTEDDYREAIKLELFEAFNFGEHFFQPNVKVVFKDLTYETIKDEKFRQQLEKSFKGLSQQSLQGMFDEHDAAPELMLPKNDANISGR